MRRVLKSIFGLTSARGEPPLEGEAFKGHLFTVMKSIWKSLASQDPALLVCDDLHWSDPASVDLLLHLLPLTDEVPLLLLIAMRPERQGPVWRVRQAAASDFSDRTIEINLQPLPVKDSGALVDSLLKISDLPAGLRKRILEKAKGNPFFVEEVVRTLI